MRARKGIVIWCVNIILLVRICYVRHERSIHKCTNYLTRYNHFQTRYLVDLQESKLKLADGTTRVEIQHRHRYVSLASRINRLAKIS